MYQLTDELQGVIKTDGNLRYTIAFGSKVECWLDQGGVSTLTSTYTIAGLGDDEMVEKLESLLDKQKAFRLAAYSAAGVA